MSLGFFSALQESTTPRGYRELRQLTLLDALKYLFWLGILALLIKIVFFLPTALAIKESFALMPSQFEKASFTGIFATKEPVLIPSKNPFVQIDTSSKPTAKAPIVVTQTALVITKNSVQTTYPYPDFSKTVESKESQHIVMWLILLTLPSILFIIFIGSLLKALLIGLVMGSLGYIYCVMRKSSFSYSTVMSLALFSTTSLFLIEALIVPLRFSAFLFPLTTVLGATLFLIPLTVSLCIFLIWIALGTSEKYLYS